MDKRSIVTQNNNIKKIEVPQNDFASMNHLGGTLFKIFDKLNIFYMRDGAGELHLKEVGENGNMASVMQS